MYENSEQYLAYQHANETTNPSEQIIMLYAASISYVKQAKEAMEKSDHDTKCKLMTKALSVIRGLRTCLDFQANEQVAIALNNYYDTVEDLLISAQAETNVAFCDKIIENLMIIKKAWENINISPLPKENSEDDEEYKPQNMII